MYDYKAEIVPYYKVQHKEYDLLVKAFDYRLFPEVSKRYNIPIYDLFSGK
jgi:hypothetical protein